MTESTVCKILHDGNGHRWTTTKLLPTATLQCRRLSETFKCGKSRDTKEYQNLLLQKQTLGMVERGEKSMKILT